MKDWIWFFVGIPHQHFHPQLRKMRGKYDKARRGLGTHGALPSGVEEVHRGGQVVIIIDWEHFLCFSIAVCTGGFFQKRQIALFVCVHWIMSVLLCSQGKLLPFDPHHPANLQQEAQHIVFWSIISCWLEIFTLLWRTHMLLLFFFFYQQQIQRISISGCSTSKDKDPLSSVPLSSSICHGSVSFPAPLGGKKKSFFMQLKGSTLPPVAVRRADA